MMWGDHVLKHWSRTQNKVSLSSGEAELYALVKASAETIGMKHLIEELGATVSARVATDSSAAKGIAHRVGSGRLKHVELNRLWVQEAVTKGDIMIRKVPRDVNFGDVMTHYWDRLAGEQMFWQMGFVSNSQAK